MKPKRPPRFDAEEYCKQTGKVLFRTKQKAYKAATSMRGPNGRSLMTVYKCDYCKFYHLAHKRAEWEGK